MSGPVRWFKHGNAYYRVLPNHEMAHGHTWPNRRSLTNDGEGLHKQYLIDNCQEVDSAGTPLVQGVEPELLSGTFAKQVKPAEPVELQAGKFYQMRNGAIAGPLFKAPENVRINYGYEFSWWEHMWMPDGRLHSITNKPNLPQCDKRTRSCN